MIRLDNLIIFGYLILVGCTPNIKEYDPEKMEYIQAERIKMAQQDPFYSSSTPSYVKLIEEDEVYVEAIKLRPEVGPTDIKLDTWVINVINRSAEIKCVTIDWKLMDFDFESDLPHTFVVDATEILKLGKMKQTVWAFDDTFIALPPSGYVNSLNVVDAQFDEKINEYTCDILERDIQEPK
ncbi:MAG: hypothetical protein ACXW2E_01925 [Nitrososphaeraceae archaeon]